MAGAATAGVDRQTIEQFEPTWGETVKDLETFFFGG